MTYVMLEPKLIKEVAAELDFLSEAEVEFSLELIEALIEELLDAEPFCDHSVGICACSTQGVIEALRGALVGMKDCPACFGDTFVYVEYHQPDCWEALKRIGDCTDVHMVRCGCWHGKVFEHLHMERTADAPRKEVMMPGETILSGAPETCPDCGTFVLPFKVLESGAGWYIGTMCQEGPYSRESGYFRTREEAETALATNEWEARA